MSVKLQEAIDRLKNAPRTQMALDRPMTSVKDLLDYREQQVHALVEVAATFERDRAKLIELLLPFAFFAAQWERKPFASMDDRIYGIHAGTEWEAELRRSDCARALEYLKRLDVEIAIQTTKGGQS